MNTALLVEQLTIAILGSAIAIPAIQRFKNWLPSEKFVEPTSALLSFLIGAGVAIYYAEAALLEAAVIGLFSLIGAETIYKTLGEKMSSYTKSDVGHRPDLGE